MPNSLEEPTMVKKKILVTGGTDGIGREAALLLISMGHEVTIAGRSSEKAVSFNEECYERYEKKMTDFLQVDLSSLQQTHNFANTVAGKNFDICIMNAGLMNPSTAATMDGNDMTMMTNLVSAYITVSKILAEKKEDQKIHFVFITSLLMKVYSTSFFGHQLFDPSKVENWQKAMKPEQSSGTEKYAISKVGHATMAVLVNRLKLPGVTATSIHPGCVITGMMSNLPARQRFYLSLCQPFITTKEQAGVNVVHAAFNPLPENKYYESKKEVNLPTLILQDSTVAAFKEFGDTFM